MKLLFNTRQINEAERVKHLLETKGIPVFISNQYQNNIRRPFLKLLGVWVYLNEQEADARRVLENPKYKVMKPVDVEGFYAQLPESDTGAMVRVKLIKWLLVFLLSVFLIAGVASVLISNQT